MFGTRPESDKNERNNDWGSKAVGVRELEHLKKTKKTATTQPALWCVVFSYSKMFNEKYCFLGASAGACIN